MSITWVKDSFITQLTDQIDIWYISQIDELNIIASLSCIFSKKKNEYAPERDVMTGSRDNIPSNVKYQVIIVTKIMRTNAL
jgi:hypothetical protein